MIIITDTIRMKIMMMMNKLYCRTREKREREREDG